MTKAALSLTDMADLDPAASGTAPPEADGPQVVAPCPAPSPAEPPLPLLAPYFGLVAAMLCTLIGAWLLLAPYAFDYRHAAAKVPQSTTVDLGTGGAVFALAVLTAALFAGCIARRLQAARQEAASNEAVSGKAASAQAPSTEEGSREELPAYEAGQDPAPAPEPEPVLAPPIEESFSLHPHMPPLAEPDPPQPAPDTPGTALRDLLAPLVAALTADLNSRERERDYGYGYDASRGSAPSGGRGPDE